MSTTILAEHAGHVVVDMGEAITMIQTYEYLVNVILPQCKSDTNGYNAVAQVIKVLYNEINALPGFRVNKVKGINYD